MVLLTDDDMTKGSEQTLEKKCSRCGESKAVESFYASKTSKNGYQSWCKVCYKTKRSAESEWNRGYAAWKHGLKSKFNMTPDDYFEMLGSQHGVCAICYKSDGNRRLAVDHDHSSGEIRGLLCRNCNVGLGHFKDDTEIMTRAILYIEGY